MVDTKDYDKNGRMMITKEFDVKIAIKSYMKLYGTLRERNDKKEKSKKYFRNEYGYFTIIYGGSIFV